MSAGRTAHYVNVCPPEAETSATTGALYICTYQIKETLQVVKKKETDLMELRDVGMSSTRNITTNQ